MHRVFHNLLTMNSYCNGKFTLLVVAFVPIFIAAGFWQLDRARQKEGQLNAFQLAELQQPLPIATIATADIKRYQPVTVKGHVNGNHFFLDNQVYQRGLGYEVLQFMQLDDGRDLLISRGWVQGNPDRRILPEITPIEGQQTLTGYMYPISRNRWIDAQKTTNNRRVIPALDPEVLALWLGKPCMTHVFRLTSPKTYAFTHHWPKTPLISAHKHRGYAFQWFTFAVIAVGFFLYSLKQAR